MARIRPKVKGFGPLVTLVHTHLVSSTIVLPQASEHEGVDPLPHALLRVEQSEHVTLAHVAVGAVVARPPLDSDVVAARA